MYQTITTGVENKIARITLSREERRNALTGVMITELLDAFKKYDDDPEVSAIVLTGAGDKAFCAGADLSEVSAPLSFLDRHEEQRKFTELFKVIKNLKKPLIGRINGYAFGGGFGLAAACDIVIASEDVQFGTPEINVGLFPYIIMAILLRFTSQPKRLLEMMLTGERMSAQEAQQLGLVNYVVPRDQLDAKVNEIGEKVKKSPAILRLGRRAFYTMQDMEFEKALEYLVSMLSINMMAEDMVEGISAFIGKRQPVWKGR